MRLWWTLLIVGCASHPLEAEPPQPQRVQANVVHPSWAEGLAAEPLSVAFDGPADGTQLVQDFLSRADAARARYVSELAIYLQTSQDGHPVECRMPIVPATYEEPAPLATAANVAAVTQPIRRTVTDHEYRCRTAAQVHTRPVYTQERRCGWRTVPVTTHVLGATVGPPPHGPTTQTTYVDQWVCDDEIVKRTISDRVTPADCGFEPVTRTVTRPAFQLDNQYVPPRFAEITRQRLRELAPVCYAIAGDATPHPQHRIEGRIFVEH